MSLSYAIRQIGDVTVLDLSGRVSLTETPSGPGGEVLLHELVRNAVKTGSKKILINLRDVTYCRWTPLPIRSAQEFGGSSAVYDTT
jgi:anti-anti-sigma regulatory factor